MDAVKSNAETGEIHAILEGGPVSIPGTSRSRLVSPLDEKIKVPHEGGYEHFERTSEITPDGHQQPVVYRWTMRTAIAELPAGRPSGG